MKFRIVIFFSTLLLVTLSCKEKTKDDTIVNVRKSIGGIYIDTVKCFPTNSSLVGFWALVNNDVVFCDQIFGTISFFDRDGNETRVSLGLGEGPSETAGIYGLSSKSDESISILNSFTVESFNKELILERKIPIKWNTENLSYRQLENDPQPDLSGIYEILWRPKGINNLVKSYKRGMLLPIGSTHPLFNGYMHEKYYEEAAIFGLIDPESGEFIKLGGTRGDIYLEKPFIPNFDFISYDVLQEEIHVTFGPDPAVYVFDQEFNKILKYGTYPDGFKHDYHQTRDYNSAEERWRKDMRSYGYNDWLYCDEKTNRVFRTVKPTGVNGPSVLQVYEDQVLVGELDVPERFRVVGRIGDEYIADGIVDEENFKLAYYRFKLKVAK